MAAPQDPHVRFGAFQLNLLTGELRKSGARINLPDQPFQILKALLERPGELISREELRQRLWSAETFVDFEHGLNAAVRRLRDALGDSADVPRFIETLPRHGYRFIAPVIQPPATEEASSRPEEPTRSEALPPPALALAPSVTRARVLGIVATMVLVAAAFMWAFGYRSRSTVRGESTGTSGRSMLAVLPFENLTGDPEQQYLADGMTEELIAQLGRMDPSRLGVISRTSAMTYKGTKKTLPEIARELGVDAIVEGSVVREHNHVRVTVQLIDARTDNHIWASNYVRDLTSVLALQGEVAQAIADEISINVTPQEQARLARERPIDRAAHDLYLQGIYLLNQGDPKSAVGYLQKAIEEDPNYAQAHAALANGYGWMGEAGWMAYTEAFPRQKSEATKAIELDHSLPQGHAELANAVMDLSWDWANAEKELKLALELNPNLTSVRTNYAFYLERVGRVPEAISEVTRVMELDPVSSRAFYSAGIVYYFARQYDQALAHLQSAHVLEPHPPKFLFPFESGVIYAEKGMYEKAVGEFQKLGDQPHALGHLGNVYARMERVSEAHAMISKLEGHVQKNGVGRYEIALVYAGLGESDEAFNWLGRSFDARDKGLTYLKIDPCLDPLRADPRFARLVQRVGLPL